MSGPVSAYLVCGGRWHDFDFARLEILKLLGEHEEVRTRVGDDDRDGTDRDDRRGDEQHDSAHGDVDQALDAVVARPHQTRGRTRRRAKNTPRHPGRNRDRGL